MKLKVVQFVGLCVLLLSGPALAHHSTAFFDNQKTIVIDGTIKEFIWSNPHSWVDVIVVNPDKSTEIWSLECLGPALLGRLGWTKDSLRPGEKVSVELHPLKNGRTGGGECLSFTYPDGRKLVAPDILKAFDTTKDKDAEQ